ncbi:MAG: hypothetical protein LBU60_05065 [Clostridiales bacterium]|jgi:hypothetical protein|nr:hypothetical protein [Clostridiales bacterium]
MMLGILSGVCVCNCIVDVLYGLQNVGGELEVDEGDCIHIRQVMPME